MTCPVAHVSILGAAGLDVISMKRFNMPQRKGKPNEVSAGKSRPTDAAFDVWLNRGLHQMFDEVAREPVPEEWLKLIEEDRDKED